MLTEFCYHLKFFLDHYRICQGLAVKAASNFSLLGKPQSFVHTDLKHDKTLQNISKGSLQIFSHFLLHQVASLCLEVGATKHATRVNWSFPSVKSIENSFNLWKKNQILLQLCLCQGRAP
jgi:hypothetical protein